MDLIPTTRIVRPSNIWFTADMHFGHANVIQYSNRPFYDVNDMDDRIIANWNAVVQPNDIVYILGDCGFMPVALLVAYMKLLNGVKILTPGNHDASHIKKHEFRDLFQTISGMLDVRIPLQFSDGTTEKISAVICHYPLLTWNKMRHGAWNLHGHCHGTLNVPGADQIRRLDVGVDCFDYAPVNAATIYNIMLTRTNYTSPDHHAD